MDYNMFVDYISPIVKTFANTCNEKNANIALNFAIPMQTIDTPGIGLFPLSTTPVPPASALPSYCSPHQDNGFSSPIIQDLPNYDSDGSDTSVSPSRFKNTSNAHRKWMCKCMSFQFN